MKILGVFRVVKDAAREFAKDDAMSLAAAMTYYTALSFAPLLLILLWIGGLLGDDMQQRLSARIVELAGPQAGTMVKTVLASASGRPDLGTVAGLVGIGTLLFSAAGLFAQVQHSLNRIWKVRAKAGQGLRGWARKRTVSLGIVLGVGVLLITSLSVSAVLVAVLGRWAVIDHLVAIFIFTGVFGLLFRYLPDVNLAWRDVWPGAAVTAVLFAVGRVLITLYLGRSSVGSAYGAAGSLIVLLLWAYYSGIIFFFGAELTQVWAHAAGRQIVPNKHAQWIGAGPAPQPGELAR